jgi:hypothetical protein
MCVGAICTEATRSSGVVGNGTSKIPFTPPPNFLPRFPVKARRGHIMRELRKAVAQRPIIFAMWFEVGLMTCAMRFEVRLMTCAMRFEVGLQPPPLRYLKVQDLRLTAVRMMRTHESYERTHHVCDSSRAQQTPMLCSFFDEPLAINDIVRPIEALRNK